MSNNFTVIKGKSDTVDITRIKNLLTVYNCWQRQYHNAICKTMEENEGKKIEDFPQEDLMKIALSGVKHVISVLEIRRENARIGTDYTKTLEESQATFDLIDALFSVMGCLTVKNFVTIFPITKEYDGEKWQSKDYFYTIDVLSKMDWDKPIGRDNMYDLLWDYQNDDLREVCVEFTCAMSAIYRSQTGKGITEEWCDDLGIPTYSVDNTNGIMRDNQTGKVTKIKKKSHIQVVK